MPAAEPFKLLLVEDNPGDVDLAKERLSNVPDYTFELTCVSHLRDAVEILRKARIDVVLLDPTLPDSTGIETVGRTRTRGSAAACATSRA
jgi:CheY-like chemotaxis protein